MHQLIKNNVRELVKRMFSSTTEEIQWCGNKKPTMPVLRRDVAIKVCSIESENLMEQDQENAAKSLDHVLSVFFLELRLQADGVVGHISWK